MKIEDFITQTDVLLDVRSPSEFAHGHIPGARSFPLFTDSERAQVGTLYKQEGHDAAVRLGLQLVGPKLSLLVKNADRIANSSKTVSLYCWRGGMRSKSVAWLLETAGFKCNLLTRGYKTFRHWALNQFKKEYPLIVIGGLTGSGKTELLNSLKQQNEQVLDLEELANHQGSGFGNLGLPNQPSNEHFTNLLACQLSRFDLNRPIWLEDESRMIGTCQIPHDLFSQMLAAPFMWIEVPKEERVQRLLRNYGRNSPESLIQVTKKLSKRLGSLRADQAVQHLNNQNFEAALLILLEYYDKAYSYSCQKLGRIQNKISHPISIHEFIDLSKSFYNEVV